ncbi:dual adapter for phosphotyrosine and 3-phosphotyrosine and 3-phosphoinositide [Pelomyxa schiedti]|nr:dual adapter for phosphotyrosine and 3-phosphotyrosine and 3-phosphoinositide [Pelomyxa schiedti]
MTNRDTRAFIKSHWAEVIKGCCVACVRNCQARVRHIEVEHPMMINSGNGECRGWTQAYRVRALQSLDAEEILAREEGTLMWSLCGRDQPEQASRAADGNGAGGGCKWSLCLGMLMEGIMREGGSGFGARFREEWVGAILAALDGGDWAECGFGGTVGTDLTGMLCTVAVETDIEAECVLKFMGRVGPKAVARCQPIVNVLMERMAVVNEFLCQCTVTACEESFEFQTCNCGPNKTCGVDDYAEAAVRYCDVGFLDWFLNKVGRPLPELDPTGKTVESACKVQSANILKVLIKRGVEITAPASCSGLSHLICGETSDLKAVKAMVDIFVGCGLDINKACVLSDGAQVTPLYSALENGRMDIAEILLSYSPEVHVGHLLLALLGSKLGSKRLSLVSAIAGKLSVIPPEAILIATACATPEMLKYLIDQGGEVNVACTHPLLPKTEKWRSTFGAKLVFPLQAAMLDCSVVKCQTLLDAGAKVFDSTENSVNDSWYRAFVALCSGAHTTQCAKVVERLLGMRPSFGTLEIMVRVAMNSHTEHIEVPYVFATCRGIPHDLKSKLMQEVLRKCNLLHNRFFSFCENNPCRHAALIELLVKYGGVALSDSDCSSSKFLGSFLIKIQRRQTILSILMCQHPRCGSHTSWGQLPMASFGSIIEGYLVKQGRNVKSWKRRLFVAQANVLYYFSGEKDVSSKGFIMLSDITSIEERPGGPKPNMFAIVCPARTLLVSAETLPDAEKWIECLRVLVALQSYRNAFSDGPSSWGVAEPFLKNVIDKSRKILELGVQLVGIVKSNTYNDKSKRGIVYERVAAGGFETLKFCTSLLALIRSPLSLENYEKFVSTLKSSSASYEALGQLCPDAHELLSRISTETIGVLAMEPASARSEVEFCTNSVITKFKEFETTGTVQDSEVARLKENVRKSFELVAAGIKDKPASSRMSGIAQQITTAMDSRASFIKNNTCSREECSELQSLLDQAKSFTSWC